MFMKEDKLLALLKLLCREKIIAYPFVYDRGGAPSFKKAGELCRITDALF